MKQTYTRTLIDRARQMRKEPTPAERKLWHGYLRGHSARPRRQRPFGGYIVDFYVPSRRLVLELDGPVHEEQEARSYDEERTRFLEARGLRVVRFRNDEVLHDFLGVTTRLDTLLK